MKHSSMDAIKLILFALRGIDVQKDVKHWYQIRLDIRTMITLYLTLTE